MAAFVTYEEASRHLRAGGVITSEADLEQLEWLCEVASEAVEADLGRAMSVQNVTELHDGGSTAIVLEVTPVVALTSVTNLGAAVDSFLKGRVIYPLYGRFPWGRQAVTVTYQAGYSTVPNVAKIVALNTVQAMWQSSQQAPHPHLDESAEFAVQTAVAGLPDPLRSAYESLRDPAIA